MGVEIKMSGGPRPAEKRQARRYRYRAETMVRRLNSDPSLAGCILNLSARGCLLRLPELSDYETGTLVDVSVNSRLIAFRALGSVRHCSRNRRLLGISFLNLSQRGEAALLDLIADLEADAQAGRSGVHQINVFRCDAPPNKPGASHK
jgi:hypothetical protein